MNKGPAVFLLTTIDNPHSPFTNWIAWYMEDLRLGYDTCGLVSRLSIDEDIFNSEAEVAAMRSVVTHNYSGKHILVTKDEFEALIKNPS